MMHFIVDYNNLYAKGWHSGFGKYGVANLLISYTKRFAPDTIHICADYGPSFRVVLYPEYKQGRAEKPEGYNDGLKWTLDRLEEAGMSIYQHVEYESDDIIAKIAENLKDRKVLLTNDKDMVQLLDTDIFIMQKASQIISAHDATIRYGVQPHQFVDYLSLVGDTSDNIPGVYGIGPAHASTLIHNYGNLDTIYESLSEIPIVTARKLEKGKKEAYLAKELITLRTDFRLEIKSGDYNIEKLQYVLRSYS